MSALATVPGSWAYVSNPCWGGGRGWNKWSSLAAARSAPSGKIDPTSYLCVKHCPCSSAPKPSQFVLKLALAHSFSHSKDLCHSTHSRVLRDCTLGLGSHHKTPGYFLTPWLPYVCQWAAVLVNCLSKSSQNTVWVQAYMAIETCTGDGRES